MYATRRRRREAQPVEIPDDKPLVPNNNNNNSQLPSNEIEILEDVTVNSKELFLLILKLLQSVHLNESVEVLSQELLKNNLLPRHYDWKGNPKPLDVTDLCEREYGHLQPNHLVLLLQRLIQLSHKQYPPPASFIHTLIGEGAFSLLSPKVSQVPQVSVAEKLALASVQPRTCSSVHMLRTMEFGRRPSASIHPLPSVYQAYDQVKVIQGHKNPVYCLIFDKTGHRFITGSDDKLVKIWWVDTGQLIRTLRGHSRDITDLSVNDDNTLLASADNDNFIRVWSLVTYTPVAVFSEHAEAITAIRFVTNSNYNGLISTDFQGAVKFWNISDFSKEFVRPIAEFESNTVLCSDVSRGGTHYITSGDNIIRVWQVDPPQCVGNLFGHTAPVRSLRWSHNSDRFLSGSDDSSVRVWSHDRGQWHSEMLDLGDHTLSSSMVLWSLDDTYAISAVSAPNNNNAHANEKVSIRVWDSRTAKPIHTLVHHERTIYVLENHPQDKKIILSASYDGMSILWDIEAGVALKVFKNQPNVKMCDGKFSPSGSAFAISDSSGQVSLFCFGVSQQQQEKYNSVHSQQFFVTDYNPLQIDMNGYAIDANSQLAPHLMADLTLCDSHLKVHNEQPSTNYDLDFNKFYGWKSFYDNERLVRLAFEALERNTLNFQATQPLGRNAHPGQAEPVLVNAPMSESEEEEPEEEDASDQEESGQSEEEPAHYSDESDEEDFFEGYASDDIEHDDGRAIRRSKRHQRTEDDLRGHYFKWNLRRKRSEGKHDRNFHSYAENSEASEEDISMEADLVEGSEEKRPKKRRKKIPEYFADWLQRTDPNTNAYLPQMGDNVHYFKQGHKMYAEKYPHATEMVDLPWDIYENLNHAEECLVKDIVYRIDNPTYCTIKLQLVNYQDKIVVYKVPDEQHNNNNNNEDVILDVEGAENTVVLKKQLDKAEEYKNGIFYVNFHGDSGIGDYLVLSSRIQDALPLMEWKEGDEFKSLFDDGKYYTGKILENNGVSGQTSPWECLRVIWDESGEEGNMSPWEIESIEKHTDKQPPECIETDITDIVTTGLNQIYTLDISMYFRDPVSLSQYPDYIKYVAHPMDLQTLLFRMENKYYRRLEPFLYDSRLILKNAQSYNMEGSQVVNLAKKIDALLLALYNKAEKALKAKHQPPSEDSTNISNNNHVSDNISNNENNITNNNTTSIEGITIEHSATTPMEITDNAPKDITNISKPYIPESVVLQQVIPPPPSSVFDDMIKEALEEEKHYVAVADQDQTANQTTAFISRKKHKSKSKSSSSKKASKEKTEEHMAPEEFFKQFSDEESSEESTQLQPTTSRQRSLRRQRRQELLELQQIQELADQLEPVLPTGMHLRTRSKHIPQHTTLDFPEEADNPIMPTRLRSQTKRLSEKTTTTQPRKIVFGAPPSTKKNLVIKFKQQGNQWDLQKAEDKLHQGEDNKNSQDNNNNADASARVTRSGLKLRVRTGSKSESPPKPAVDTSFEEKDELDDFELEEEKPKKSKKKKAQKGVKKKNGKSKEDDEEEVDENADWTIEDEPEDGSDASQNSDEFSEDEDDQIIDDENDSRRRSTRSSNRNNPAPIRRSSRILSKEFGLEDDGILDVAPEPEPRRTRRAASTKNEVPDKASEKKADLKLTIKIPKQVSNETDEYDFEEDVDEKPRTRSSARGKRRTRSQSNFIVEDDDEYDDEDE